VTPIRYTLLSDGSSDQVLCHPINWLMERHASRTFMGRWADLSVVRSACQKLEQRIEIALKLYPCELLFVHRDAEARDPGPRVLEIRAALPAAFGATAVCVVPVRMTEAWLLFDESAIRAAAGNPNGREPLHLPAWRGVEGRADPKNDLYGALGRASGVRRRRHEAPGRLVHRLAELIDDFSPLLELSAFRQLQSELSEALAARGWLRP
jgi:hypothetical protein